MKPELAQIPEFSFTKDCFGVVFWYFVFTQKMTNYSVQIEKNIWGSQKKY